MRTTPAQRARGSNRSPLATGGRHASPRRPSPWIDGGWRTRWSRGPRSVEMPVFHRGKTPAAAGAGTTRRRPAASRSRNAGGSHAQLAPVVRRGALHAARLHPCSAQAPAGAAIPADRRTAQLINGRRGARADALGFRDWRRSASKKFLGRSISSAAAVPNRQRHSHRANAMTEIPAATDAACAQAKQKARYELFSYRASDSYQIW